MATSGIQTITAPGEKREALRCEGGGGHQLEAAFVCKGFKWQLQQVLFTADVIVLPLGCCDLILGIQWLKSLGPILWDFDKLQMEFTTHGKKFVLRGAKVPGFKLINNKSFAQAVQKGAELCFLSISHDAPCLTFPTFHVMQTPELQSPLHPAIADLILKFEDIFKEPRQLPPPRPGFDHRIPLKEGAEPFNLRPYRFSLIQKDIIDKLVQDMLDQADPLPSSFVSFAAAVMDVRLPLDKLALKLISSNDPSPENTSNGRIYVVLVATGSFNPPTFMHLRMFELARDALNSKGYCVIGGYMSPVNDAYKKKNLISADHRIQLCHLACRSSEFVMVDPWEANQSTYQRTLTVLSRVHTSICETGLVSRESLKVMLVCGSDLLHSFSIPGFWIPKQVKSICRDYGVVCIRREGQDVEKTISDDNILNENQVKL
ncbi:hypothetical protein TSUD_256350 [Trifolium subterraneum]|uniref:Cytidyltransferase-like domain-containing protein n=1 Tax=Trifolium subterraneum TaxID=3900 RepID=A0A2Z6NFK3_TRISU|nr:hypothetical protein TSUD_256350 [Trifolium subterraneum]